MLPLQGWHNDRQHRRQGVTHPSFYVLQGLHLLLLGQSPLLKSLRQEGVPLQDWSPVLFFILGILRDLPEIHLRSQQADHQLLPVGFV